MSVCTGEIRSRGEVQEGWVVHQQATTEHRHRREEAEESAGEGSCELA